MLSSESLVLAILSIWTGKFPLIVFINDFRYSSIQQEVEESASDGARKVNEYSHLFEAHSVVSLNIFGILYQFMQLNSIHTKIKCTTELTDIIDTEVIGVKFDEFNNWSIGVIIWSPQLFVFVFPTRRI